MAGVFRYIYGMPQPFVSLCLIFRDNADSIPAFLKSIAGVFDEVIACDTGSKDGSRKLFQDFGAKVIDFEWCDDFGKARQASFDAATGRWRMFLDTDDQLVNGANLKHFLINLEAKHSQMEGVFFGYDYAQNEYLDTMRICRWRPGWAWNDAIHERLEFGEYPLPPEAFGRTREIFVKHAYKTDAEKAKAIRRNEAIAIREYASTDDPKYKARLARTIAMAMKMDGRAKESLPYLEELYGPYRTYPEGRQAAADLMKAYLMLGDFDKALDWAKKAGPSYEAIAHHARKEWPETLKANQRGAGRGQQTTHEGLLFEKGAAYVAAADAALSLPVPRAKDVALQLLEGIPATFRNDPLLVEAVQTLRGRVNRVTILVPGTPQPFDETGGGGMLGGSEEAVLYLTEALVKLGRNVRIFCPLPPQRISGVDALGRDWQDITAFDADDEHGTLVIWRAWQIALNLMEAKAKGQKKLPGIMTAWMWLHDTHCGMPENAMKVLSKAVTGAITLSDFHTQMIQKQGYEGNIVKLSNGIVEDDFVPDIGKWEKDWNRVVYSSDPSRGLVPLLKMWPAVKEACPKAYLDIYYDWSMVEVMQPENYQRIMEAYEAVKHLDVKHHGGVDHPTLNAALKGANVLAYSHFESPLSETFCITAVKALAAGCSVITVPNGALREVCADDAILCETEAQFQEELIDQLKDPESTFEREHAAKRAIARYGWYEVAKRFSSVWTVA